MVPLRALEIVKEFGSDSLRKKIDVCNSRSISIPVLPVSANEQDSGMATVAILLCTLHGERFLSEQLASIEAQTHKHWNVFVSDDGSNDGTLDVLDHYRSQWGDERISIFSGPEQGVTANFLSLTCKAEIQADYYAFADQDDIWEADKLARSIDRLQEVSAGVPALYCSRTRLVNERGRELGFSPLFTRRPSFANALVQNIGGGNTMVYNKAARNLLCEAGGDVYGATHDWWAYMVISGCGGKIIYDPYPSIRYRQHAKNLVGANASWMSKLMRTGKLLRGSFRKMNDRNARSLLRIASRLTPENRRILNEYCAARQSALPHRLYGIKRSGIYRQTLLGNLGLIAAAILNKL